MRIADILSSHLEPGAVVVDLTPPEAGLTEHTKLPPHLALSYRADLPATPLPGLAIVLQTLPMRALDPAAIATRVVQIAFFERRTAPIETGLLEELATTGWELVATHTTGHDAFPLALVATPSDLPSTQLRILDEYRFNKLLMREQDADLQRVQLQLARQAARLDEAVARIAEVEARLAEREADLAGLRLAVVAARQDAADQAARAHRTEAHATDLRGRLAKARGSFSFRVGRATTVALRELGKDPLGTPRRWVSTFGGRDEQLDELE